jgi:hypothetical protein
MPDDAVQPLNYAERRPRSWLKRWRWRLLTVALLIAVAVPIARNRKTLIYRSEWLYWSHECAVFHMPQSADPSVTDPVLAQQLLASNPDYKPYHNWDGAVFAVYAPRVWRELTGLDPRTFWITDGFNSGDHAILFLGSRRRPDRTPRLVVVAGSKTNGLELLDSTYVLVLPHPAVTDSPPTRIHIVQGSDPNGRAISASILTGNSDSNDPSHVTFPFRVYDWDWSNNIAKRGNLVATGTLDAYLQNDDSLLFKLRQTPELSRLEVKLEQDRLKNGVTWW